MPGGYFPIVVSGWKRTFRRVLVSNLLTGIELHIVQVSRLSSVEPQPLQAEAQHQAKERELEAEFKPKEGD
jgi:non-canonical (house-cleaning) NTP pyrophosphatase